MSNPRVPYRLASDRKRLAPPQANKPLIVHLVVNIENWPFDQPMPRKLLPGPHGNDKIQVLACEGIGVTPYVPKALTSGSKAKGRFGKQDFVYLADGDVYRCPAGRT